MLLAEHFYPTVFYKQTYQIHIEFLLFAAIINVRNKIGFFLRHAIFKYIHYLHAILLLYILYEL